VTTNKEHDAAMSRTDDLARRNLFDELLQLRDRDRARARTGINVVKGGELPWELNQQGKMKWYLHPAITDTTIRNYIFYMQEIPPGSRGARLKQQGDEVLLILEGQGYTELDGVKHFWKAGDVVGLPLKEWGLVVQHFNLSQTEPARFVAASPNFADTLGVDRGCGFEVLEPAPEWREDTAR
jgi:quercetin dioxygenase-like cupin family protein